MTPEQKKQRQIILDQVEHRMIEIMEVFEIKPDCIYMDFRTYEAYLKTFPVDKFDSVASINGMDLIILPFPHTIIEVGMKNGKQTIKYGHANMKVLMKQTVKKQAILEHKKNNVLSLPSGNKKQKES